MLTRLVLTAAALSLFTLVAFTKPAQDAPNSNRGLGPGRGNGAGGPYYKDEDKVERKAVILNQPAPQYTDDARRQSIEGKVVLDVVLRSDGRVKVRAVVSGLPHGLTERAIEAAQKIKFTPAEDEGEKITVLRRVEYVFALDR